MKVAFYTITIILITTITSCKTNIYEDISTINNALWQYNDTLSFDINITKTKQPYNVYIDIENTNNYKYSNLFLFVSITAPDNSTIVDTIDIFMADYKGKWVGKEKNNNYFGNYLYKRGVVFPNTGIYKTTIVQGMRDDELKGITKLGISVSEAK